MHPLKLLAVAVLAAVSAIAADLNGAWKAQVPTRGGGGGTREVTFTFKVEGENVTGTMADERGSNAIRDGKLTGNTLVFAVETQRGKRTYTGTVSGDEIKFKREGGQSPQEFVARRAQ